jgi:hypothetical protein
LVLYRREFWKMKVIIIKDEIYLKCNISIKKKNNYNIITLFTWITISIGNWEGARKGWNNYLLKKGKTRGVGAWGVVKKNGELVEWEEGERCECQVWSYKDSDKFVGLFLCIVVDDLLMFVCWLWQAGEDCRKKLKEETDLWSGRQSFG